MASETQQSLVLEVLARAARTCTREEFDQLIEGPLRSLLGYEVMMCGTGYLADDGCYTHKLHNHGYPIDYFYELEQADGTVDSPLMKQWRETMKPVFFQSGRDDARFPADWISVFNRYDLRNTLANAMYDRHGKVANFFIFARMKEEVGPEHANLLELITPNLCAAMAHVLENTKAEQTKFAGAVQKVFSVKQLDVLYWMYHGKTNSEISQILEMNEETVKYHAEQLMKKLKVASRTQAVAKAVEFGLIPPAKRT
jgi:DNA-binding CsgD family transcriptional regulator